MKALVLHKAGPPDSLELVDHPKPTAESGHVLVEVKAVGLNPVDYKTASWGFDTWSYPHILGLDVAGVIVEADPTLKNVQIGSRVYYHGNLAKPGGFAQYALAPHHILAPIPDGISFEHAAALPCAGFTAWQILSRKIQPQKGQTILIHGGAGGVGGFAVQFSKYLGLKVFTTCSSENFDTVRKLGADQPIDYATEDVTKRVMELTAHRGVDIALNTVDSLSATEDLGRIAFGGHLACVAGFPDFSKIEPFTRAISIHESALGGAHLSGDILAQRDLAAMGKEVMDMLKNKHISSMLAETISLEQIPEALARLAKRHVRGKIVATL